MIRESFLQGYIGSPIYSIHYTGRKGMFKYTGSTFFPRSRALFRYCNIDFGDICWGPRETSRRVATKKSRGTDARGMSYAWGHTGNRHMSQRVMSPACLGPTFPSYHLLAQFAKGWERFLAYFLPFISLYALQGYIGPLHFPIHGLFFFKEMAPDTG